jgi:hypothetical protein
MAGDLEDFLRRAAERRQQKAAQQPAPAPAPRQRPEYSDRRTERVARVPDDEVLIAEVVEPPRASPAPTPAGSDYEARLRKIKDTKEAAAKVEANLAKRNKKLKEAQARVAASSSANPAENLVRLMQQPGGIQQAILLREILDRPEHRWD